jgi:hypothetical protein
MNSGIQSHWLRFGRYGFKHHVSSANSIVILGERKAPVVMENGVARGLTAPRSGRLL